MAKADKKKDEIIPQFSGDLEVQDMIEGNYNKYLLINLLSARTRELNDGERPLVDTEGATSLIDIAIREGAQGKLKTVKRETKKVIVDLVSPDE